LDAAVAARGLPLRRVPAAIRRTIGSVFFDARTGMTAFSIDILVYELALTIRNRAALRFCAVRPERLIQQLERYVGA
jgi:hypothetical protein